MEEALTKLPGNNYEFTQPIQMRFNELIAGVRSDVAVKVYGDRFRDMQQTAAVIARILQSVPGAADVKIEQTTGLPVLQVEIDRAAIARYGLSVADVQEVVEIAIGGRRQALSLKAIGASLKRSPPEHLRQNLDVLKTLPVPLSHDEHESRSARLASLRAAVSSPSGPAFIPLGELARLEVSEGQIRSAATTASAAS
jgi:cobalt-zinc-cadmium resistance protein CzcA